MRSPPDDRAAEIIRDVADCYDLAVDEIMLHTERGRPLIGSRRARIVAAKTLIIYRLATETAYGLPAYSVPVIASYFGVSCQHMRKLVGRALARDGLTA